MLRNHKRLLALCLFLSVPGSLIAQEGLLAVRGGEVHTVSGEVIPDGVVLVSGGKIQAVGTEVAIPPGARVIDAEGMVVTPGIIDARSSFGVGFGFGQGARRDLGDLMFPERKIVDRISAQPDSRWSMGGVTAVYVGPRPQNLLGGYGAVIKLLGGGEFEVLSDTAGMSASFAESALNAFGDRTTRQGMIAVLRQEFIRVQEYMERDTGAGQPDPKVDAVARILLRQVPLRTYVNAPDDIMTAVRLAEEFDLDLVIDSGVGAYQVADLLAQANVPVVVHPNLFGGTGPFEKYAHTAENAARLHRAGVKIALSTDAGRGRTVLLEGGIAIGHGLPREAALRAVTLNAAEILGVDDRLGSLEAGKDADLVVWRNHPLSTWGESQVVIVNGEIVFQRRQ